MKLTDLKTKIVCTIVLASRSGNVLEELMRWGMNVAGLNFARGIVGGLTFLSDVVVAGGMRY